MKEIATLGNKERVVYDFDNNTLSNTKGNKKTLPLRQYNKLKQNTMKLAVNKGHELTFKILK